MLFDAPIPLNAVSAESSPAEFIQQLFAAPGNAFSLVEKGIKSRIMEKADETEVHNRFTELLSENDKMIVNLQDAVKPPSPNETR